jgi:hypothetical protein
LSALFADAIVADAFRRIERGPGMAFAVPDPNRRLSGGAAQRPSYDADRAIEDNLRRLCDCVRLARYLQKLPTLAPIATDPETHEMILEALADGRRLAEAASALPDPRLAGVPRQPVRGGPGVSRGTSADVSR